MVAAERIVVTLPSHNRGACATSAIQVGPLTIGGRVFLAPMAGITDAAMRAAAVECGAALAFSEMVAAAGLSRGDPETRGRLGRPLRGFHAVQIAGCRPDDLAETARLVADDGADLIDINMGCPAKRVTCGYAGAALMRDLGQAVALIRSVVAAVAIPVSVKMRLGWDDVSINAPELARRAENEGVAMVTVHGRTRSQFYKGRADWRAVRAVKDAVRIPVVVNGDCISADDARAMMAASGADAVMVGRAAVGRPWLVGDIAHELEAGTPRAPLEPGRRAAIARDHHASVVQALGVARGVRHARKHVAAYVAHAGWPEDDPRRRRLVTSEDPIEISTLLGQAFLNDVPAEAAAPPAFAA